MHRPAPPGAPGPCLTARLGCTGPTAARATETWPKHSRATGKAIRLQPDRYEAYYNAGLIYQSMNRTAQSSACYRKALELNSDLPQAHNNLGRLHLDAGRTAAAAGCFLQAIRLQPDFAEAHFNLGEVLRGLRRPQEAIPAFQTALRLKPSLVGAWNNLGNLLRDGEIYRVPRNVSAKWSGCDPTCTKGTTTSAAP